MDCTTSHLSQTRPCDLLHQDSGGLRIPEKLHEFGSTTHLSCAPDAMDRTTGLECRLGGMSAPEQIVSHRVSSVGSRFSAGLIINLTVSALATTGADAAGLAITETASSRTTVRKTSVVRTTRLEALIAIPALFRAPSFETAVTFAAVTFTAVTFAAITLTTVFKALCIETTIFKTSAFKTSAFKAAVIRMALLKAPVPITAIASGRRS